jgi:hypothetical protein
MPLWNDTLVPIIKSNKKLIIAAHGNTLRALVKHLDDIPEVSCREHAVCRRRSKPAALCAATASSRSPQVADAAVGGGRT